MAQLKQYDLNATPHPGIFMRKPGMVGHMYNPSIGKYRQVSFWGMLVSQKSLPSELQVTDKP